MINGLSDEEYMRRMYGEEPMTDKPAMTIEPPAIQLNDFVRIQTTFGEWFGKLCDFVNYSEKEAYARGRRDMGEEAARIAQNACLVPPDGGRPSQEASEACDYAAIAIRALIEKEPLK